MRVHRPHARAAAVALASLVSMVSANVAGHNAAASHGAALEARNANLDKREADPSFCVFGVCVGESSHSSSSHSSSSKSVSKPAKTFTCSGSGKDGYSVDYNGNSCPSSYPEGFLWCTFR